MKFYFHWTFLFILLNLWGCTTDQNELVVKAFETSAGGNKLEKIEDFQGGDPDMTLQLYPEKTFQTILGFGGAFTESSAYLLTRLGEENRNGILDAYFGPRGANYSLTRTHINSCDFSLSNYSFAAVEDDKELEHFSIEEDRDDIIPMIKGAMERSTEGFRLLASPWTAPPWMKDNNSYLGGKLLPEYYDTWALFFSKYLSAYAAEGIDIWGITVENEPLGNNSSWESMHYTPEEMVDFVQNHLGPKLEADGHDVKIFGYDQNRGKELEEWAQVMYRDSASSRYFDGTAVHWYASTYDWMPASLNFTHELAPEKHLLHTEACVDAEVPHWKEDAWYWEKEATDWGWVWASEEDKYLHPKYVPVYRYARDIIGCLNSWVEGWIDWNMVLDRQGGPNWAKNWCVAPVIVDPEKDEVYYTPLYYTLSHFSRFIRPGAIRIGFENTSDKVMATAARNTDGSTVVVILNMEKEPRKIALVMNERSKTITISPQAIQTVLIAP